MGDKIFIKIIISVLNDFQKIFQWNIYVGYHLFWLILSWNTVVTINAVCIASKEKAKILEKETPNQVVKIKKQKISFQPRLSSVLQNEFSNLMITSAIKD